MSFSLDGKAAMPKSGYAASPLPELPPQTASGETIERGHDLFVDKECSGCHGKEAVARAGGSVPDLRYTDKEAYLEWDGIVIEGAHSANGMPAFKLTTDEAEAIRAWVLSRAYELQQGSEQ